MWHIPATMLASAEKPCAVELNKQRLQRPDEASELQQESWTELQTCMQLGSCPSHRLHDTIIFTIPESQDGSGSIAPLAATTTVYW